MIMRSLIYKYYKDNFNLHRLVIILLFCAPTSIHRCISEKNFTRTAKEMDFLLIY